LKILKLNKSQSVKIDLEFEQKSLHNYLMTIINRRMNKGAKILDVGCGTASLLSMLLARGYDAHGIDPEMQGPIAEALCKQGKIEITDFLSYEKADYFDLVIFAEVLEHVEDFIRLISKGAALLNPNGSMLISVPNYWTAKITACPKCGLIFPPGGHLWKFKSEWLRKDMEYFFSKIEMMKYFHPLWQRFPLRYFATFPNLNCWLGHLFSVFRKKPLLWIVSLASGLRIMEDRPNSSAEYFENSKEYLDVKRLFDYSRG